MSRNSLLIIFTALIMSSPVVAGWQVESVGSSNGGISPAIALDSDGHPHIACSASNSISHTWNDGSDWSSEIIYGSSLGGPSGSDIAIDEQDLCHVSFQVFGCLFYAEETPERGWSASMVTPVSYSQWTSIALKSNGYPAIASCAPDSLVYLEWNGSGWKFDPYLGYPTGGMETDGVSLVLNDQSNPHMAFCRSSPAHGMMYAERDQAGTWTIWVVDGPLTVEPRGTSLALDGQGHPHISYHTQTELRYAYWDGSWHIETVEAMDTGMLEYDTSIALDAYGHPHIAHVSADADSILYSVNAGEGWTTESVCAITSMGGDPDLALDDLGRPRIAFYQGLYNGLGYAWNDDPTGITSPQAPELSPLELQVAPNPFSGSLTIQIQTPRQAGASLHIYDSSGRLVADLDTGGDRSGSRNVSWHPPVTLSDGVYFIVCTSGDARTTTRCLLLR